MKAHRFITVILVTAVITLATARWLDYREDVHNRQLLAELDAANSVRAAIEAFRARNDHPELDFTTVEGVIAQLMNAKCLDEEIARYVQRNRGRFAIRRADSELTIDARWIFDDSTL